MDWLVTLGAIMSLGGIGGLVWCIVLALRTRREALDEDAMRARFRKLTVLNMGALGVSALGLMVVVVGILLG